MKAVAAAAMTSCRTATPRLEWINPFERAMRAFFCVMMSVLAAVAIAQPEPCSVKPQATTFAIRMNPDLVLMASLGGAAPHPLQIDTGSTGIVIARQRIGPYTPVTDMTLPANIIYNSSDRVMVGQWVYTSVELSDGKQTIITIPKLAVFAVDQICATRGRSMAPPFDCSIPTTPDELLELGMMGVGFDRGSTMGPPQVNPFLRLPQMDAGTMQRGYIITARDGVTLGMTQTAIADFRFLPLHPERTRAGEWQQARGCVALSGGGITNPGLPVCGNVLMDTGVDRMFVTYAKGFPAFDPPFPENAGALWRCCPCISTKRPPEPTCFISGNASTAGVTVTWPSDTNPVFTYAASAPAQFFADQPTPSAVFATSVATLQEQGANVFVNTSRQLLYTADYLYDATCGRIGFRSHGRSNP